MRFQAVFFDFGGTLFRYSDLRAEFDALLEELVEPYALSRPRDELRDAYRASMAETFLRFRNRPFYLHRDLFASAYQSFLGRLGVRAATGHEHDLYERQSFLGLERVVPREEAATTLASLRDQGLHLGIVSNIDDDQFDPLWERVGLADYFDATTTSEEARSCKPDPGIYRMALEKASAASPEQVVFVGDSAPHDVAGANALGMTSVLISRRDPPAGGPEADHVIRELGELLEIVGA